MPYKRRVSKERGLPWLERMSLEMGESDDHPYYRSDDERRAGWERHRDRLLDECDDGGRPNAWWDYDSPIPKPRDPEDARAALWEAKLLAPNEVAMLEARWREHFDRAQEPNFSYCAGHDGKRSALWLKGDTAKQAHDFSLSLPIGTSRTFLRPTPPLTPPADGDFRHRHREIISRPVRAHARALPFAIGADMGRTLRDKFRDSVRRFREFCSRFFRFCGIRCDVAPARNTYFIGISECSRRA